LFTEARRERVGGLVGEVVEVLAERLGGGRPPDLGEFGAADPLTMSSGTESRDGTSGHGDREFLAGLGAVEYFM
jgi:hypothetical protein